MSVQPYTTADGRRWRVRWREGNGRMRSRTVATKSEALALDADIKSRKFRGDTLPRTGRQTLASAYEEWWRLCASALAKTTQAGYRASWTAHIEGRFDGHRLDAVGGGGVVGPLPPGDVRPQRLGDRGARR